MLEKFARISPTFQNFFNWPRKLQDYKIQVIPIVPNISDDSFHSVANHESSYVATS